MCFFGGAGRLFRRFFVTLRSLSAGLFLKGVGAGVFMSKIMMVRIMNEEISSLKS